MLHLFGGDGCQDFIQIAELPALTAVVVKSIDGNGITSLAVLNVVTAGVAFLGLNL